MTYVPLCDFCRTNNMTSFRLGCSGCQARKALTPTTEGAKQ